MVSINNKTKEINCKIVYYGPGLGGKTTNLLVIHKKVPKTNKSEMVSLATESDRTLFFDYLPLELGKIKGYDTKFQLYTVPGQVYYNETRKLVLRGVDGIVFVADSQKSKLKETIDSYNNLIQNLKESRQSLENIPHVIQYNKRDFKDALPIEQLEAEVNKLNVPYFEAIAVKSNGVFNTLKAISKAVINKYNKPTGAGTTSAKFKKKTQQPPAQPVAKKPVSPDTSTGGASNDGVDPEVLKFIKSKKGQPEPAEDVDEDVLNFIKSRKAEKKSEKKSESDVDDDVLNFVKSKKNKKPPVVTTPGEIQKKVIEDPPEAKPENRKPEKRVEKPSKDPFLATDQGDDFNYTPENPGYSGVSDELSDENSPFLDIKPYTGMSEGDLPPPGDTSGDIDFDPYGDN